MDSATEWVAAPSRRWMGGQLPPGAPGRFRNGGRVLTPPTCDTRLCRDAGGRYGGIREELAAGARAMTGVQIGCPCGARVLLCCLILPRQLVVESTRYKRPPG
jgi:hypothetical protein